MDGAYARGSGSTRQTAGESRVSDLLVLSFVEALTLKGRLYERVSV